MNVGNLLVEPCIDGAMKMPLRRAFPTLSADAAARHREYLVDDDRSIRFTIGALVVRSGDRTVLVDAGAGPEARDEGGPDRTRQLRAYLHEVRGLTDRRLDAALEAIVDTTVESGGLLRALERLGVRPEDVTDVVLTHLHFDHIGWVSHEGRPVFPNATHWCHEADVRFFLGPEPCDERLYALAHGVPSAVERAGPIRSRLEVWDVDRSIADGIDVRWTPGHTPGSSIVVLSSGDERAVVLGDVVHCPAQLVDDEWQAVADIDPVTARTTREALVREFDDGSTLLAGAHFPGLSFGRLIRGQGKRNWVVSAGGGRPGSDAGVTQTPRGTARG